MGDNVTTIKNQDGPGDQPNDQLELTIYRGWLDRGKYVWSPFVIKLEARLRFAGLSYATECGSTRTAPKGKIPYIECRGRGIPAEAQPHPASSAGAHGAPPVTLDDSTLIIKRLVDWGVLPDLNDALSPAARTYDLALRALLEDKLYFYHTQERWLGNYYTMRDHILSTLPYPVRVLVGLLIHRNVTATLNGQGTGRHTPDEVRRFRREIWEGINDLLVSAKREQTAQMADGDGGATDAPFWALGGQGPSESDATVFGFVVSVLICTACPESQALVKEFPVILEYADRIHDTYFPDYEKWQR